MLSILQCIRQPPTSLELLSPKYPVLRLRNHALEPAPAATPPLESLLEMERLSPHTNHRWDAEEGEKPTSWQSGEANVGLATSVQGWIVNSVGFESQMIYDTTTQLQLFNQAFIAQKQPHSLWKEMSRTLFQSFYKHQFTDLWERSCCGNNPKIAEIIFQTYCASITGWLRSGPRVPAFTIITFTEHAERTIHSTHCTCSTQFKHVSIPKASIWRC